MKYPTFGVFTLEIFTRKAGLALFDEIEGHQCWMANFYMVFEETIKSYININYDDIPDNLFGMGPKLLTAAIATYLTSW
jgi:hypothetical protein